MSPLVHIAIPCPPGLRPTQRTDVEVGFSPSLDPRRREEMLAVMSTGVAGSLVELAETMTKDQLRETFANAKDQGVLNLEAVRDSAAHAVWHPSQPMLYEVIREFEG